MLWLWPADWISEHLLGVEPLAGLPGQLGISKHVVGLFVVTLMLILTFLPFGAALRRDPVVPRGRLVNIMEAILFFLRDEVSRPLLGKAGDKFLPVLWTFFFYILYCNLLGLMPIFPPFGVPVAGEHGAHWSPFGMVTPTGQIWVTGTLALIAGAWWHCLGIKEQGLITYIKNIVPGGLPLWLVPGLFVIELAGHVIKVMALMVRLWANMTGGHAVLFAFMAIIFTFGAGASGIIAIPLSLAVSVAVYFLEIFVAFLQAYVFTFLVAVFLGMALHPDH